MKHIVFLFFNLILFNCYCQNNKDFQFIGTLQLPNGIIISYKLNFKEISGEKIEGISITDFYGENNTRSKIAGSYNNGRISFDETENISTKSSSDANEFCFIHVKNAKIKTIKGKSIIQGNFKGIYANDSSCVDGYMYLIGTDFLDQLSNSILVSENFKNDSSLKSAKQQYTDLLKNSAVHHLETNDVLKINWRSDEVILEIWDAEKMDQDNVTIFINDKKVLENFIIKKEKKIIVIPFNEDVFSIKILAVSEGEYPPNTVNVTLRDNELSTSIVSSLKKGEVASVLLNKVK